MIGEEGAKLVRPAREREKDIRREARLFLHSGDPLADVVGKIGSAGGGNRLIGGSAIFRLGLGKVAFATSPGVQRRALADNSSTPNRLHPLG